MAAAKRRSIDRLRRDQRLASVLGRVAGELERGAGTSGTDPDCRIDAHVEDDLLRLIFIACHPVLPAEARAAMTLRLLCGLSTHEIARAFLAPEPTIAQRIVRSKRVLAKLREPVELPPPEQLAERLESVLQVIYLLFNEGYSATSGEDWMRPGLCDEALRLGRILAGLLPTQAEVHGLVALMEIQASRFNARTDSAGQPILLMDQDRSRWDRLLIRRGLAALEVALALNHSPGPYTLQAAIAACHARVPVFEQTDWKHIAELYVALIKIAPSAVVRLNHAVAVGMAVGPQAGLELLDALTAEKTLANYHLLPSVRGDFLLRLGRTQEARAEFVRAATMTQNARERSLLMKRARGCDGGDFSETRNAAGLASGRAAGREIDRD